MLYKRMLLYHTYREQGDREIKGARLAIWKCNRPANCSHACDVMGMGGLVSAMSHACSGRNLYTSPPCMFWKELVYIPAFAHVQGCVLEGTCNVSFGNAKLL